MQDLMFCRSGVKGSHSIKPVLIKAVCIMPPYAHQKTLSVTVGITTPSRQHSAYVDKLNRESQ